MTNQSNWNSDGFKIENRGLTSKDADLIICYHWKSIKEIHNVIWRSDISYSADDSIVAIFKIKPKIK